MPSSNRSVEDNPPPPERPPRTIVLCFDGTSDQYDTKNTNVVKLFSLLKKDDWSKQYCYYQPGIGTYFAPGMFSPIFNWLAKTWDSAIAWYLDAHVMAGYHFIMQNYYAGDKICLFGFSRGAYTARALAGMLYKVGVLPRHNTEMIPFAYKLYTRTDDEGCELSMGFKRTFCQDVKIEFVGVWDTVASVGIVSGKTLPFANSNKAIKTFRQALALDEHRAKFRASYYVHPSANQRASTFSMENFRRTMTNPLFGRRAYTAQPKVEHSKTEISKTAEEPNSHGGKFEARSRGKSKPKPIFCGNGVGEVRSTVETSIKEVWFAGCHTDVGGGAVLGDTTPNLANLSLRWMVKEILDSNCGILFDKEQLDAFHIPTGPKSELVEGEAREERLRKIYQRDVKAEVNDRMKKMPAWWLIEILPMHFTWQDSEGIWQSRFGIHRGKGRKIHDPQPKLHVSVQDRLNDGSIKYTPRAKWKKGDEVYVG